MMSALIFWSFNYIIVQGVEHLQIHMRKKNKILLVGHTAASILWLDWRLLSLEEDYLALWVVLVEKKRHSPIDESCHPYTATVFRRTNTALEGQQEDSQVMVGYIGEPCFEFVI